MPDGPPPNAARGRPHRLPKRRHRPPQTPPSHPAPVAVRLQAGFTTERIPLPWVRAIRLELAWRGALDTRGLPICSPSKLRGYDSSQAIAICGRALVGRGRLYDRVFIPSESPFGLHARLLVFNGRTRQGHTAVWVQAYSKSPPVSFVLPFHVRHQHGPFRTVLVSVVPRSVALAPLRPLSDRGPAPLQLSRPAPQLHERLLPSGTPLHRGLPLLRPRHLQPRRRYLSKGRSGAQL